MEIYVRRVTLKRHDRVIYMVLTAVAQVGDGVFIALIDDEDIGENIVDGQALGNWLRSPAAGTLKPRTTGQDSIE